jgi:hypothetical protein
MKNMKMNKWTMGLAAAGVVTLSSVAQAQDAAAGAEALAASTTLSGYVSTGYHYGNGQEPGGENYFRAADGQNAFSLDVVDLKLSSAQGDGAMDTGYTVELWMGPAAGNIGTSDSGNNGTVELMQANIDLRLDVGNGLDLKVGQFGTIVGNEVYNYNENDLYTHSWGFAVEPTHHTGILASYDVAEGLTVGAGLANTTGPATNGSSGGDGTSKTWMASVSYTLPDSLGTYLGGSELYYGVVAGPEDSSTGGDGSDTEYHYFSVSTPLPVAGLSHKFVWDHVEYGHATQADSNVLGYYLSYKLNDDTTLNARYEWGNINADLDGDGTLQSVDSFENADNLQSLTIGLDHKIWGDNVITRLEYRHDKHDADVANNQNSTTSRGSAQDTIALNLIYTF